LQPTTSGKLPPMTLGGASPLKSGQIPSLNGLRAIAVLVVFVGHGLTAPGIWPGHVGVTIFFFLSGYLIVTLLRREHSRTGTISLPKFYLRRALRILPPAYLAVATAVALGTTGLLHATTNGWGVMAEVLNYTNYYMVAVGRDGLPPETSQLWSLGVEEHYYLVVPAVILILLRRKLNIRTVGYILLAVALVVPVWRVYLGLNGASFDRLYVSTDTRIDSLLFGSVMALLLNPAMGDRLPGGERTARAISTWLAPLAVVVFVASSLVPGQHFRLSVADVVQCACLVPIFWFVITQSEGRVGRFLNHPVMERIGVLSFSVYLFHRMIIVLMSQVIEIAPVVDALSLVATLIVAEVIRRLVDEPSAKLRKKLEAPYPRLVAADRAAN
jgi:peptidoglycan/LPS O-acetylase OafA/YrhL